MGSKHKKVANINKEETKKEEKPVTWFEETGKPLIAIFAVIIFTVAAITGIVRSCKGPEQGAYGEIISSNPSLIDIGSTDCIPCRQLQPVLVALGEKYDGEINIKFYDSWNTSEGREKANEYNVTTIPTLIFVDKRGNELSRMTGFNRQSVIEARFEHLGWV